MNHTEVLRDGCCSPCVARYFRMSTRSMGDTREVLLQDFATLPHVIEGAPTTTSLEAIMKASIKSNEQMDTWGDFARRCAGAIGHGLGAFVRLWGAVALDAAAAHLRGLDESTLMDLGFDPRDLPLKGQLPRGDHSSSRMSNTLMVLNYWR